MNPKQLRLPIATVVVLFALLLPLASQAVSINFTLTQPSQTGSPGTTLDFLGILSNPTGEPVFLNGDSSTTAVSFLHVDDTPFLVNTPASLAPSGNPGDSVGPVDLFRVVIDLSAVPGTYTNNFFNVQGGFSPSTFETLATQRFTITVLAPVPEPSSLALLLAGTSGLLTVAASKRFRRYFRRKKPTAV